MANLKEIRTRLGSVTTTRQITSAMKMVSAAKLRKAQDAVLQLRPYASKLQDILSYLTSNLDDQSENIYGEKRELDHVLLVVFASNKGLCGGFNSSVTKRTIQLVQEKYQKLYAQKRVDILVIGKKGAELLKAKDIRVTFDHHDLLDDPRLETVSPLAESIMTSFEKGDYDEVILLYNQFKNAATQLLTEEQFLPIPEPDMDDNSTKNLDYILEPSKEFMLEELIPKSLKMQFFKALLDSCASEHGARMTAMHKATDNSTELIKSLQLEYNKARQAAITKEILEIVGGAEALKS